MTGVYGVDIGVRSFAVVHLWDTGAQPWFETFTVPKSNRQRELQVLYNEVAAFNAESTLFAEEPPLAGSRNVRVAFQLNQVFGSILSAFPGHAYAVPVPSWKKAICGRGNIDKSSVADWLRAHHPELHQQCGGDQNLVDAACIALYGQLICGDAAGESLARAGGVDISV